MLAAEWSLFSSLIEPVFVLNDAHVLYFSIAKLMFIGWRN